MASATLHSAFYVFKKIIYKNIKYLYFLYLGRVEEVWKRQKTENFLQNFHGQKRKVIDFPVERLCYVTHAFHRDVIERELLRQRNIHFRVRDVHEVVYDVTDDVGRDEGQWKGIHRS